MVLYQNYIGRLSVTIKTTSQLCLRVQPELDSNRAETHSSALNRTVSIRFKRVLDGLDSGPIFMAEPYRFLIGSVDMPQIKQFGTVRKTLIQSIGKLRGYEYIEQA